MKLQNYFRGTEPLTQYYIVIIRVVMGMLFIYHGRELFDSKAMTGFAAWLDKDLHFPLPLLMAYLRTGAEFFGGIMLIIGLFTRLGSFLICFTMLVAGFRRLFRRRRNALCVCSDFTHYIFSRAR